MTEKSHVGMEAKLCEVCCNQYETGAILLERRFTHYDPRKPGGGRELRKTLNPGLNITGVGGKCKKCDKLYKEGYIALVGITNPGVEGQHLLKQEEDADRTGAIAHIKQEAFDRVFNVEVPSKGMLFCDQEVIEKLQAMVHPEDREEG